MSDQSGKWEFGVKEFGEILRELRSDPDAKMRSLKTRLFGVKYYKQIEDLEGAAQSDIWVEAGEERGHSAHLSYGVIMGPYVSIRPNCDLVPDFPLSDKRRKK